MSRKTYNEKKIKTGMSTIKILMNEINLYSLMNWRFSERKTRKRRKKATFWRRDPTFKTIINYAISFENFVLIYCL